MELAVDWAVSETIVYASMYMVATFAISTITSRFLSPNGNQSANSPDSGLRQQVPPDTTQPIPVVYGDAYIGGKFVDAVLSVDQKVMRYVMALSCISENGQVSIDATKMYYGDRLITFDGTDACKVISLTDTAGNVDTTISGSLYIFTYKSDKDGNITSLTSNPSMPWDVITTTGLNPVASGQEWTTTGRRMNGLVFSIIVLGYNQTAGTTALQPITFLLNQYLFDTGYAGAGSVWYDYMTNKIYGGAVDPEFIDTDSAVALEAYGNELITFNDYNGNPQTQPRYRINGVIDPSQSCLQNVDQIMTACDSWQRYDATSGKWSVVINEATSVSYNFDDSNLVGAIVVGTVDLAQMPNKIQARFPDSTNRDQYNYVNESVPSGLLLPNEPVNQLNVNYDLVNNSVQALYLANRVLEQGREDLLVTITTTYDGIQVNAGDVVAVTNSYYGWTNKQFRAMQVKESIAGDGILSAQIQLVEYNSGVYDNATIDQYTPSANGNLASAGYFSALSAPTPVNVHPYISVPSFDISVFIPTIGRVSSVILYYTTVATPSSTDWKVLDQQVLTQGESFAGGSSITFPHYTIPANTYYFAYTVGNDVSQSQLSPISTAFAWTPDAANASSFVATFSPAVLQVPYSGSTPTFTDVVTRLYGTNGLGAVDFVASQTDTDSAFINGTWRIGGSSTTGYGSIVETNITIPNPTDGGSYADFGQPTAMSASPATMAVPVRYKDLAGVVHQVATPSIQYTFNVNGSTGPRSSTGFLYYAYSSASAPSTPSASGYNFTYNTFSSITSGWSSSFTAPAPSTNPSSQAGSHFWAVTYSVSEATFGGTQTITISSPFNWQNLDGLVTFTNVTSPSGTTFIDGGNIITNTITVSRLQNNTSGTFNSGTFQLGTGASISGIAATAAFTGTSSTWGAIVANNSNESAFAAVTTSTSGGAGGVFANAYTSAYNSFRTATVLADPNYAVVGDYNASGFYQGIVGLAGYAFYAGSGGYGPFTGGHDALIANGTSLVVGDIVVDTDVIVKKSISDTITVVAYSTQPNQMGVLGVVATETPKTNIPAALSIQVTNPTTGLSEAVLNPDYAALYHANQTITVNALGEGQINVCGEGGDISIGDLIVTSSTMGKGMKQADDIIRSYTVGKSRENVTFSSPSDIKEIGIIYVSG